jgi:hypothetical protein
MLPKGWSPKYEPSSQPSPERAEQSSDTNDTADFDKGLAVNLLRAILSGALKKSLFA